MVDSVDRWRSERGLVHGPVVKPPAKPKRSSALRGGQVDSEVGNRIEAYEVFKSSLDKAKLLGRHALGR